MTKVASLRGSAYAPVCDKCGETPIAPEWSEYFADEQVVLNLWSCARCGNRFETEAFEPVDPASTISPRVVAEFLPALLVA